MTDLALKTFQRLDAVAELEATGVLRGEWTRVLPGTEDAYAAAVAAMARAGIDCAGHPPVWAWHGTVRLRDAEMLFDPTHELSAGFASLTFSAPESLVLLSDYGDWCEVLFARDGRAWEPQPPRGGFHPAQACLPYVRADWVSDIVALPTTGWDTLDLEQEL